jgi:hypothetical protein
MPEKANGGDHKYVDATLDDQIHPDVYLAKSVYEAELDAIKKRRLHIGTRSRDQQDYPITGLALSGGGIRSASFGLGALQALDAFVAPEDKDFSGIDGIDYLSTVSGGGYIGCSMTAALQKNSGEFPFKKKDTSKAYADTESVGHIRDFSNYLIPHGALDVVTALGIIGRGIVANVLIILPVLLFFVWFTLLIHPTVESLDQPKFLIWNLANVLPWLGLPWGIHGFWFTIILAAFNVAFLIFWAFAKSISVSQNWQSGFARLRSPGNSAELRGGLARISKALFFVTFVAAALDLHPYILWAIATPPSDLADVCTNSSFSLDCFGARLHHSLSQITSYLTPIGTIIAPAGAVFAFFSKYLTDVITSAKQAPGWIAGIKGILAKAALWFAAIIVPFCLWLLYLWLTYIGLDSSFAWWLYLIAFVITAIFAAFINPNATSLYRLYRDRLSKAFLFDPDPGKDQSRRDIYGDIESYEPKLHDINTNLCPYPIVNAALNIEGSPFTNKRGRNADFFIFTPEYTGSGATGYIGTSQIEDNNKEPALDLGTAMAISGAAVSSNMGSETIRPLAFTLALLNIRLGYWLYNPYLFGPTRAATPNPWRHWIKEKLFQLPNVLLFAEMFSWIDEKSPKVYLTDGGHIENLGIYSLMKRRCEVIIAIDAEADPAMGFASLLILERYARIDIGAIIDLPWQAIRNQALQIDKAFDEADKNGSPIPCSPGPHCAAGEIQYGPNKKGILLYVKASLSGDEDDYILDYKRRYRAFPHETTGDQFFGEEQLEAYRALGFHIVKGLLSRKTPFAVNPKLHETDGEAQLRILKQVREALGT